MRVFLFSSVEKQAVKVVQMVPTKVGVSFSNNNTIKTVRKISATIWKVLHPSRDCNAIEFFEKNRIKYLNFIIFKNSLQFIFY